MRRLAECPLAGTCDFPDKRDWRSAWILVETGELDLDRQNLRDSPLQKTGTRVDRRNWTNELGSPLVITVVIRLVQPDAR